MISNIEHEVENNWKASPQYWRHEALQYKHFTAQKVRKIAKLEKEGCIRLLGVYSLLESGFKLYGYIKGGAKRLRGNEDLVFQWGTNGKVSLLFIWSPERCFYFKKALRLQPRTIHIIFLRKLASELRLKTRERLLFLLTTFLWRKT